MRKIILKLTFLPLCLFTLSSCATSQSENIPEYLKHTANGCWQISMQEVDLRVSKEYCQPYLSAEDYQKTLNTLDDFSLLSCKDELYPEQKRLLAQQKIYLEDEYNRHLSFNAKKTMSLVCYDKIRASRWRDSYEKRLQNERRIQEEMKNF